MFLVAWLAAGAASAADWSRYVNARFAYAVDIPPGFSAVAEAENSDGGTSTSDFGNAVLSAWGTYLSDTSLPTDVGSRIDEDASEGWTLGYRAVSRSRASWSMTRGGRIQYTRAILQCGDRAIFARLEYDASTKAAFDPIVSRVARSLKGAARC